MTCDKRSQVRKFVSGYILASPKVGRSSATAYRGTKDTSSHYGMGASTKQQHLQLEAAFVFQQPCKLAGDQIGFILALSSGTKLC